MIRPPSATVYRFLGVGLTLEGRGLERGGGRFAEGLRPEDDGLITLLAGEVDRGRPETEELGVSRPDGRPEYGIGLEETEEGGELGGEKWPCATVTVLGGVA